MVQQRIQVAHEHRVLNDGTAFFVIYDSVDHNPISLHTFGLVGGDETDHIAAQRRVAQSIADALNFVPMGAVEHIRQTQRAAAQVRLRAVRRPNVHHLELTAA